MTLISALLSLLVGASFGVLTAGLMSANSYDEASREGHRKGYVEGWLKGYNAGHSEGKENGRKEGGKSNELNQ